MSQKKIIILGTGGHGWKALSNFILNTQAKVTAYGLTVDHGGSQGVWYRLLESNNYELSKILYSQERPGIPWGDFNKIIGHFLTLKYGSLVGECLNFRSDNLKEHLENYQIFSMNLGLEKSIEDHFQEFFIKGFNYYLKHKGKLEYQSEKKFCFGYPWQDYVYWNLEGIADVNKYYHSKGILPPNLFLDFVSDSRQILVAKDDEKEILGEHLIDSYQEALEPDSLIFLEKDHSPGKVKPGFLNDLVNSDLIIIPPGSMANWLPLVNHQDVLEILREKSLFGQLIWILNPERKPNEYYITGYINYLSKLEVYCDLVGPLHWKTSSNRFYLQPFFKIQNYKPCYELDEEYKIIPESLTDLLNSKLKNNE